ncbi:MAG: sugar transferase [Bacteroidetes bacterium]|nr:sugar transferase [Bacteroidota bacterium]
MIWRSGYHRRIAQLADFGTAFISFVLAYFISALLHRMEPSLFPPQVEIRTSYILIVIVLSMVYEILFDQQKAYSYQRFTSLLREYSIVMKVCFIGSLISISVLFLFGSKDIPRTIFIIFFIVSLFLFIAEKSLLFYAASLIRRKGRDRKRVILIGTGTRARNFITTVKNNFHWGLDIVGMLTGDIENVGLKIEGIKVLDHYKNIQHILKTVNPEEIIITISTKRFDQIRDVLEICEREGVAVRLNSDFFGHITKNVTIDNLFGLSIISFNMVRQPEMELFIKRIIDIAGSLAALIIFSPFMVVAAIGIWISDGKPILYHWNVIGINKKPFKSWKFRTMVKDADKLKERLMTENEMDGPVFKIKDDPRIIKFGKWLRKWSIDETPQLFSVLKGDMSLVGPRPAGPHELERYDSWQRRKLSIKPGITCLWQINGRNQIRKFDDWVKLDLEYIDNWSLLLDIKILLKTIPSVILGRGAS